MNINAETNQQSTTAVTNEEPVGIYEYKTDECNFCETIYEPDTIRFQCTTCKDYNCCPECYLSQVSYKRHKHSHKFYARSDFDFVIWPDGFTLHDDLTLLEAIEALGFGNWERVKTYMMRPESEPIELLIRHYFYVYGTDGLLSQIHAQQQINPTTTPPIQPLNLSPIRFSNITDPALDDAISSYFMQTNSNPQPFIKQTLTNTRFPTAKTQPDFKIYNELPKETGEGQGQIFNKNFWARRLETGFEQVNKAEYAIMNLKVEHGLETKEEMNMKIQVLQAYAHRLVQRERGKKYSFQMSMHRKDGKIDEIVQQIDQVGEWNEQGEKYKQKPEIKFEDHKINKESTYTEIDTTPANSTTDYYLYDYVNKFENEHPYLIRAFSTRKACRKYIYQLVSERWLRLQIFYTQIARILGYKKFDDSVQGEMIEFLKNPRLQKDIFQLAFPPGVIQFSQYEKQTFRVQEQVLLKFNQLVQNETKAKDKPIFQQLKELSAKYTPQEIWNHISSQRLEISSVSDLLVILTFSKERNCICEYINELQLKSKKFNDEILTKLEHKCLYCHKDKSAIHDPRCLYAQLSYSQLNQLEAIQDLKFNLMTQQMLNSNQENILSHFLGHNSENYGFQKRTIDQVMWLLNNTDNIQQQQALLNQSASNAMPLLLLISHMIQLLCAGISFGLSYREALQLHRSGKQVSISLNNISMDSSLIQAVIKEYLKVDCSAQVASWLYNLSSVLFSGNSDVVNQIEAQALTTFQSVQNLFQQTGFDPDKIEFSNYTEYSQIFQCYSPLQQKYFDLSSNNRQFIKPISMAATTSALFKRFCFNNSSSFLELLYASAAAAGYGAKMNQVIYSDLVQRSWATRASDFVSYSLSSDLLRQIFAQLKTQNGELSCASHQFQPVQLLTIGSASPVLLPLRIANIKQRPAILFLNNQKIDKFLRKKTVQAPKEDFFTTNVLSSVQFDKIMELLTVFTSAFEQPFKQLLVLNQKNQNWTENCQIAFNRLEQSLSQFNQQLQKYVINKQLIGGSYLMQKEISKNPLDYLFGPQIKPMDADTRNLQLLKTNFNKARLRQSKQIEKLLLKDSPKEPKENKGRPKDDQASSGFIAKFLTRGEIGLCIISGTEISTYINAKLIYISCGYISNQVVAALEYRPGLAEAMAYLTRQQSGLDTYPQIQKMGPKDHWNWIDSTAHNVFSKKIIPQQEIKDPKIQTAKVSITFSYMHRPVHYASEFQVQKQEFESFKIEQKPVDTGLLVHAAEIKDKATADLAYEKLKLQVWNSSLFQEYRKFRSGTNVQYDAGRMRYYPIQQNQHVQKSSTTCQTTKSYWWSIKQKVIEERNRIEEEQNKIRRQEKTQKMEEKQRLHEIQKSFLIEKFNQQQQVQVQKASEEVKKRGRKPKPKEEIIDISMLPVPEYNFPRIGINGRYEGVFSQVKKE
ncbi:Conserved_hypothetical protein [Hexamita inflata]|uniref:Uncharacterized protein n=1 Tax=Hexamita inflata TaxID=28002 RepID=A0AA86UPH4_9EUKA|nr:Conserved hypothetical protein [Hexamita inflata]